jgi:Bacterial PH domain
VSSPDVLRLRPRRIRVICGAAAAAVLVVFSAVGTALRGSTGEGAAVFRPGDQLAMIGIGVLAALAILAFTRPRAEADERGIRIRNLVGGYDLPWDVVAAVRFDRGSPWASLELRDDEVVQVMAVQVMDKEYAVEAVRALRRLHAAAQARQA